MSQPTVTVFQGTQPVQVQTTQPVVVPAPVGSETLPHRESHKWLGIVQMCIGSLCLILSIIGYCVGYVVYFRSYGANAINASGGGIYTGVFYIIAGLLGFLAYRNNSRCLVVACMVMNIIATVVTVVGLGFMSTELAWLYNAVYKYFVFQRAKCIIIILCCVIEFITTIVHAAFSCASSCRCCLPRQAVTRPVQPLPRVTVIPGQAYQMPQQQSIIAQQQQPGQIAAQQVVHTHQQQLLMGNNPQQQQQQQQQPQYGAAGFTAHHDKSQLLAHEVVLPSNPVDSPPQYSELPY